MDSPLTVRSVDTLYITPNIISVQRDLRSLNNSVVIYKSLD